MTYVVADSVSVWKYEGGTTWTDIGRTSVNPLPVNSNIIWDIVGVNGRLYVSVSGGIHRLDPSQSGWTQVSTGEFSYGSFFAMNGHTYVASVFGSQVRIHSMPDLTPVASDNNFNLRFNYFKPGAVTYSPMINAVCFGNLSFDSWAIYRVSGGYSPDAWVMGDDHAGSCVFAIEEFDGALHSGDYEYDWGWTYRSYDGLQWTLEDPNVVRTAENKMAEVWRFVKWNGSFYAFTCAGGLDGTYAEILRLNAGTTQWETVYSEPVLYGGLGDGYVDACVTRGNEILIGCGGEYYYYRRVSNDPKVLLWDGTSMTRLSSPGQFTRGPYIVRDVLLGENVLRQYPRDDGLVGTSGPRQHASRNQPTSRQGSLRQGWRNTYR